MITTTVSLSVSGQNYEQILEKLTNYLSDFFNITQEEVTKKINIEIQVKDQTDSLDFEQDEEYTADVIAQVTNV